MNSFERGPVGGYRFGRIATLILIDAMPPNLLSEIVITFSDRTWCAHKELNLDPKFKRLL